MLQSEIHVKLRYGDWAFVKTRCMHISQNCMYDVKDHSGIKGI